MKKGLFLIAVIFCFQAYSQRKPKIKGNRSVVEVQEDLPAFNAIELNDDLEIMLKKSSREGYEIEADDNLIDVLKFKVEDSTLFISSFYKIIGKKKLKITVNYTELVAITANQGEIENSDVVFADELEVNAFGSSRLILNATADIMEISMEGMSSGDFNIASDSLNIVLKNRVDARIYSVGESSYISMYNNASAKLEGTVDDLRVDLYEDANLKAEKLEATRVLANLQDSPYANVYAKEEFDLSSKGSSKTHLYGNPKITLTDFLDTSQLHKEK
ncbi:DUF2807 domain-containing protein [Flavobacteriaceae bacterium TP-CH-4]|uniref:DUF2807 domain-containing protein n=1 Tax=Pelagihabitans pacificus TaxID=2696054 RepID=A0A967AVJ4_9FLAO|nr:DUF2807 domain-containing protein [Pelagihabitans pacificus]NHF58377.1 DUF2807 domain-containing protein [Pelagihabitans pacificus]